MLFCLLPTLQGDLTEDHLRDYFSQYGEITDLVVSSG